jgi:hypothetical protein
MEPASLFPLPRPIPVLLTLAWLFIAILRVTMPDGPHAAPSASQGNISAWAAFRASPMELRRWIEDGRVELVPAAGLRRNSGTIPLGRAGDGIWGVAVLRKEFIYVS